MAQLTPKQIAQFWKEWNKVKAEHRGLSAAELEHLRHELITRVTGQPSLKEVDHLTQFEVLMTEVCQLSGNIEGACYWTIGSDRRTRLLVERCARQVAEIAGWVNNGHTNCWDYVRGICEQANLPATLDDIAEPDLMKVFMMLDTHRRRLIAITAYRRSEERR